MKSESHSRKSMRSRPGDRLGRSAEDVIPIRHAPYFLAPASSISSDADVTSAFKASADRLVTIDGNALVLPKAANVSQQEAKSAAHARRPENTGSGPSRGRGGLRHDDDLIDGLDDLLEQCQLLPQRELLHLPFVVGGRPVC